MIEASIIYGCTNEAGKCNLKLEASHMTPPGQILPAFVWYYSTTARVNKTETVLIYTEYTTRVGTYQTCLPLILLLVCTGNRSVRIILIMGNIVGGKLITRCL